MPVNENKAHRSTQQNNSQTACTHYHVNNSTILTTVHLGWLLLVMLTVEMIIFPFHPIALGDLPTSVHPSIYEYPWLWSMVQGLFSHLSLYLFYSFCLCVLQVSTFLNWKHFSSNGIWILLDIDWIKLDFLKVRFEQKVRIRLSFCIYINSVLVPLSVLSNFPTLSVMLSPQLIYFPLET